MNSKRQLRPSQVAQVESGFYELKSYKEYIQSFMFGKLKKKVRKGGKTKADEKVVNQERDHSSHEAEEKNSSGLPLSDQKSQGQLTQPSCSTAKNSSKSPEQGKMEKLKMSHSLDHPGSPDCFSVPPHPKSQSLDIRCSNSSQQGTAGSVDVSGVGGVESSSEAALVGHASFHLDSQEFAFPDTTASTADMPQNLINRKTSVSLGTSSSKGPLQSDQEAFDASQCGQPPNLISRDLMLPQADQASAPISSFARDSLNPEWTAAESDGNNGPQQLNANMSDMSANIVSAASHTSQGDQVSAPISSFARDSLNPEGAVAENDGRNDPQQLNANMVSAASHTSQADQASAAIFSTARDPEYPEEAVLLNDSSPPVSLGLGENPQQSLTPHPVQVEQEGEVEDSAASERGPQANETINNNYENFKVAEKIRKHRFLQDKITSSLDHTSHRVIKCWEHLACTKEINAPLDVRLKCKLSAQCSFTIMLFDAVTADADKTVKDLMDALTAINRNDVKQIITDIYPDAANSSQNLSEFVSNTDNNNLLAKMATLLDQKSRVNKYWLHLGHQFKLSSEKLKELEYGQYTEVVMEYLYDKKPDFSVGEFYEVVKKLRRNDVLKKLDPFIVEEGGRNKPMKDVIELDSDTMRGICVCLNNPNKVLKNWRHLAKSPELGIPEDVIKGCTPERPKSPTEALLEWIYGEKPDLTVGQLCRALQSIDRNDIVRDIKEFFQQQPTPDQQHPD